LDCNVRWTHLDIFLSISVANEQKRNAPKVDGPKGDEEKKMKAKIGKLQMVKYDGLKPWSHLDTLFHDAEPQDKAYANLTEKQQAVVDQLRKAKALEQESDSGASRADEDKKGKAGTEKGKLHMVKFVGLYDGAVQTYFYRKL